MPKPKWTMDQLREQSLALRAFKTQDRASPAGSDAIGVLTGNEGGPAVYDLTEIWRAALADPGCVQPVSKRRYMSPRRYVRRHWPMVSALDEPGDGRILVDGNAAWDYTMRVDIRVMSASIFLMIESRKAAAAVDPIGNAVDAARGGSFAMMFARADAGHLGLSGREFNEAVLERAKQDARHLDDYAAEKLLSQVRQALEGGPRVETIRP
jgi:hypothetical protein